MRQRDWLRCSDPERMIDDMWRLQGYIRPRRYRLFVLTSGRRLWDDQAVLRPAVELAWRVTDGEVPEDEVTRQLDQLEAVYEDALRVEDLHLARPVNVLALLFLEPAGAARTLVFPHPLGHPGDRVRLLSPGELAECCGLIREFFGTSGGPGCVDPEWLTEAVVGLAHGISAERAFDRLPVLADALEDAGCTDKNILGHCRGGGRHLPGCWVVDLLTGRL